jgi:hypothetical protein
MTQRLLRANQTANNRPDILVNQFPVRVKKAASDASLSSARFDDLT